MYTDWSRYFGVQSLAHEPRGEFLQERFGFKCGCALCRAGEELAPAEVQARLDVLVDQDAIADDLK